MSASAGIVLSLWLSDDGVAFNVEIEIGAEPTVAPVYPGLFKGGSYGYPDVHIDGQTMRVVVSRAKEKIVGYEFQLPGAE